MKRANNYVKIIDTTCRDGMHAIAHQFSCEQVGALAEALEDAKVYAMEVAHGDGLGGSSLIYGIGAQTDEQWLRAARSKLRKTKLAILFCTGIGVSDDLRMAVDCGAQIARLATHCTEVNLSHQYVTISKQLGLEVIGVMMMIHSVEPDKLLEQAKLLESYGVDAIYCMDSAGHLLPDGVKARMGLLAEKLMIPVGFHAHANLGMAVANTLAALEVGVSMTDGTLRGLGAGAGNTPTEVIAAVLKMAGYETGIDLYKAMDAAEDVLAPMLSRPPIIDKVALSIGIAGVYASFALHAKRAAERYKIDARDILMELGRRKVVGGQEDMIIEVACELANKA
ncbi:MAG TPA: 4-hydroxy-2-oxovalerate aldolase [Negativicutes bacterium]|nr:4-hydroxy-2-oxovalerate aldolase [Negativicutes bacterium]